MSHPHRCRRAILILFQLLAVNLYISLPPPLATLAQGSIQVEEDRLAQNFPEGLDFHLKASSDQEIQKVLLLYGSEGRSCQSGGARQELEFDASPQVSLSWEWDFTLSGTLPPGAEVWWQWEITDAGGSTLLTEKQSVRLEDQRSDWRQVTQDDITVQWYEGSQAYGSQILNIARKSLARLEKEAGLRPEGEIWLTVYPTFEKLRQVQKVSAEWTGATAFPDHNAILLAIPQDAMNWAGEVIPHELAHLVSGATAFNCRGAWLPTWLEEGLAEYAAGPVSKENLARLEEADQADVLPALHSLERGFSAYSDEATLSYIQSASVIAYLLETYTPQKMQELIEVIKEGNRIDDALVEVYGIDTLGVDNDWRAAMGYNLLPEQSAATTAKATATRIPTLALYTSAVRPTNTATLTPSPIPTSTPAPSNTLGADAANQIEQTAAPATPAHDSSPAPKGLPGWLAGAAVLAFLAVLTYFVFQKRRKST